MDTRRDDSVVGMHFVFKDREYICTVKPKEKPPCGITAGDRSPEAFFKYVLDSVRACFAPKTTSLYITINGRFKINHNELKDFAKVTIKNG
jgi:hypothetical protein